MIVGIEEYFRIVMMNDGFDFIIIELFSVWVSFIYFDFRVVEIYLGIMRVVYELSLNVIVYVLVFVGGVVYL